MDLYASPYNIFACMIFFDYLSGKQLSIKGFVWSALLFYYCAEDITY